jgi:glycine betaine/choline ABC-type transport system substrate-binding protein
MRITRSTNGLRGLIAMLLTAALALGIAACGSSDDNSSTTASGGGGGKQIVSNPKNGKVSLTIGSKNFTEQIVLGEIYSQALQAAGYKVDTKLDLGSETVALQALKGGQITGYPEYASTALTSFFGKQPEQVPSDPQKAYQDANAEFQKEGLTAFPPTPFSSANAVGTLKKTADKLGLKDISDLKGKSQNLTLYGSPECRQRIDCLLGLEKFYGLKFKKFVPVDIGLRYTVLDKGQADLSILFTTDAQLAADKDKYVILNDDKHAFPAGNVIFVTDQKVAQKAGPDYQKTITQVQSGLTTKVMQELDARVDIDHQQASDVAHQYLTESGYIG